MTTIQVCRTTKTKGEMTAVFYLRYTVAMLVSVGRKGNEE